jgi:hypothetical protein
MCSSLDHHDNIILPLFIIAYKLNEVLQYLSKEQIFDSFFGVFNLAFRLTEHIQVLQIAIEMTERIRGGEINLLHHKGG